MQSRGQHSTPAKRLLRACAECSRRKTRCDRRRPCRPCLQRNQARQCLALSLEDNTRTPAFELALLKERVAELEAELSGSTHQYDEESLAQIQQRSMELESSSAIHLRQEQTQQELESLDAAIDDLNLGVHLSKDVTGISFLSPQSASPRQGGYLPSRDTSFKIVTFTLNELGWIHCGLRASVFFKEHQDFWTSLQYSDYSVLSRHAWLSTYYAVLSVGIYYMEPDHECFLDFGWLDPETARRPPQNLGECASLAMMWYRHSLYELERSDFLGKPRLSSVQTIVILTLLNSSFGESEREWLMMGAAINIARSLRMHRLGKEVSPLNLTALPVWSTKENRALGRRLWWTLCICDWLGNMSRPTSIAPANADTDMTLGIDDEDLMFERPHVIGCPSSTMSLLDYHHTMARLASTIQTHMKDGHSAFEKNLVLAMQSVEEIYRSCPQHLREGLSAAAASVNPHSRCHHHKWAEFQGYLFTHTVQFLRLTISRAFLNDWLRGRSDHNGFRKKAIDAAEIIVQEKTREVSEMFRKSWIVCASTVAAGVMLSIDLLCFSNDVHESELLRRRHYVQTCIKSLESLQAHNAISKGGPAVLRRLLLLESTWDRSTPKDKSTLRSILDHVTSRDTPADQSLGPKLTQTTVLDGGHPDLHSQATAEGTGFSPDAFDGIFATAFNEIDMFENPFEFDDDDLHATRWTF